MGCSFLFVIHFAFSDFSKVKGVKAMIHKERNGFVAYIDGDRLDLYKTQKEAEKRRSRV